MAQLVLKIISNNYLFLMKFMLILSVFLKKVECDSIKNNSSYTEKYQSHIPCSFAYKVVCIDNRFSKKVVLYRGKNAVYKFIEAILSEYSYCRGVIRNILIRILLCIQKKKKEFS